MMLHNRYRRRINIVVFILLGVFVIMFLLTFLADSLTEQDTIERQATISSIDVGNNRALIYTEEFSDPLLIMEEVYTRLDCTKIESLKPGDILTFQTRATETALDGPFIPTVSLSANNLTIFSLSDYNACMHLAIKPARIASVVVCIVLILILLFVNIKKRKHKTK